MDLNPLLGNKAGVVAVDARIRIEKENQYEEVERVQCFGKKNAGRVGDIDPFDPPHFWKSKPGSAERNESFFF